MLHIIVDVLLINSYLDNYLIFFWYFVWMSFIKQSYCMLLGRFVLINTIYIFIR